MVNHCPSEVVEDSSPSALRDAWSRYWAQGAPHSCVGSYGDCYGGAIAAFWHGVFGELPAAARVLDIATGNGALPRLLLQEPAALGVQCDAVDIATIRPSWLSNLGAKDRKRVRFHGGVDAAALPFDDRSFNLVVSQYGIEYTDLNRTLPELLRVRAIHGRIALVLHHIEGRPASLAEVEIDHLAWLLRSGGMFEVAAALVEPMARTATIDGRMSLLHHEQANAARERFNALLSELSARASGGDGTDVLFDARDATMSVLVGAGQTGAARAAAALTSLREQFASAATRLHDLRNHALRANEANELRAHLAATLDAPVSLAELRDQGHLMGWTIQTSPQC